MKLNTSFERVKQGWDDEIIRLAEEFGEEMQFGGLTVKGHSYWVILEYGSSPKTPNPGPSRRDIVHLSLPSDVPQVSKRHRKWYPIRPRRAKRLVYWHHGRRQVRRIVHHPGNISRGFIRRVIAKVQASLYKDLLSLANDDTLPSREELREVFNRHLLFVLQGVRAATPVEGGISSKGVDPDGFIEDDSDADHLRDAWGVDLAR